MNSKTELELHEIIEKVIAVHGSNGLVSMAFGLASCFSDYIVEKTTVFPILFHTGPAASGKSALADWVNCVFGGGKPDVPLRLDSLSSITRATLTEPQPVYILDEYRNPPNSATNIDLIKNLWDRCGYIRGDRPGDHPKIAGTFIFIDSEPPSEMPAISRCIINPFTETQFSEAERHNFASVYREVMGQRGVWRSRVRHNKAQMQQYFMDSRDYWGGSLRKDFGGAAPERMIESAAILLAVWTAVETTTPLGRTVRQLYSELTHRISYGIGLLLSAETDPK